MNVLKKLSFLLPLVWITREQAKLWDFTHEGTFMLVPAWILFDDPTDESTVIACPKAGAFVFLLGLAGGIVIYLLEVMKFDVSWAYTVKGRI